MAQEHRNPGNIKEDKSEYLADLRTELGQLDPTLVHCNKLVQAEIDRINKGGDGTKPIEIHRDNQQKLTAKVLIPVKDFPKVNFVGKLIGPGGATLKRLQHELMVRLAIYGRGSMRDKNKEEELRKEGGKYAHLNDDLHVYIECSAQLDQAYQRIGHAINTLKQYFDPNFDDGNVPQREGGDPYGFNGNAPPPLGGGPPRGGGGARGMPPRGGMMRGGGGRGRGGHPPPGGPPSLLGAPAVPSSRGAGARGGRGSMRGSAGDPRAAPVSRASAPMMSQDRGYPVEDDYYGGNAHDSAASYDADNYGSQYEHEPVYPPPSRAAAPRDQYSRQSASEVQSFDYGHGAQTSSYESDSWGPAESSYAPRAPASARGRAPPQADYRSRPYPTERPSRGQAQPRY